MAKVRVKYFYGGTMPRNLMIVLVLTGFVHILTTMSYAMWIVGTRTQKIAVSF